jgi:hypothetical protein
MDAALTSDSFGLLPLPAARLFGSPAVVMGAVALVEPVELAELVAADQ